MARGRPVIDKDGLLHAALTVFSQLGFRKATMAEIASEAGIATSTLYNHFRSKDEIYKKTTECASWTWFNHVKEKVGEVEGAYDKFMTMGKETFSYLDENIELRNLIQKDPSLFTLFDYKRENSELGELEFEVVSLLRSIIERGVKEKVFRNVDFEKIAAVIFSIYRMFVVKTFLEHPGLEGKQFVEETIEFFLRGLCVPGSGEVSNGG